MKATEAESAWNTYLTVKAAHILIPQETDLEIVLGEQSALPSRYNVGTKWGERWPHTIDPSVFFDEEGKLWLCYGSWSGGIWMLELDEETGLRDYDVEYPSVNGSSNGEYTNENTHLLQEIGRAHV